ncbi:MAG TPA: hypothetical protein VFX19_05350 [Dehalococcoidia bacterium]|jgi:hypothetical protein|nr:hypothetical protein [Dehalococcoidia bacterium]
MPSLVYKLMAAGVLLIAAAIGIGALVSDAGGPSKTPAADPGRDEQIALDAPPETPEGNLLMAPSQTPEPPTATATLRPSPTATPPKATATLAASPASAPATPTPGPTATPASQTQTVDFSGRWRMFYTVLSGAGAGQSFSFDIVLRQNGTQISGGNAGMQIGGYVTGNVATLNYIQPSTGYSGTFVWTQAAPGVAQGTFTSSYPNSGTSTLQRLP